MYTFMLMTTVGLIVTMFRKETKPKQTKTKPRVAVKEKYLANRFYPEKKTATASVVATAQPLLSSGCTLCRNGWKTKNHK